MSIGKTPTDKALNVALGQRQTLTASDGRSAKGRRQKGEVEMMGDDVSGIAVHIAARAAQHAKASEVLASSTVKDLVAGAGLKFVDQGQAELKGLSEPMRLFAAVS